MYKIFIYNLSCGEVKLANRMSFKKINYGCDSRCLFSMANQCREKLVLAHVAVHAKNGFTLGKFGFMEFKRNSVCKIMGLPKRELKVEGGHEKLTTHEDIASAHCNFPVSNNNLPLSLYRYVVDLDGLEWYGTTTLWVSWETQNFDDKLVDPFAH
ncbi:hypothetical protein H6P81_009866 [Aristolochia fimbriata]|uniref:Uncharacterized protein n=1 Tax=Aristolochia fimbriata TaxID=158543 RepID=A0AAV7EN78_ARIFI|nr:hypothetical protein H6P81_009866 [Aristolochia fimbriata]